MSPVPPDDQDAKPAVTETPYRPKRPRNLLAMLALSLIVALLIIGGIVKAVFSHYEDPATIEMPVHTTKSLAEDQPLPTAAPVVRDTPTAAAPVISEPEQKEVPLNLNATPPVSTPATEKKTLIDGQNLAPQSMIPVAKPIIAKNIKVTGTPQLAIVIDDMGLNIRNSHQAVDLPAPVTLAYIPYAENVKQQEQSAFDKGHELIVHMPMEPDNLKGNNPGPDALLSTLPAAENVRRLKKNLDQSSLYIGINNHMGSKMTASAAAIRPILQVLKERGLWFLDSRTIGTSVAGKIAGKLGVPYAERDVFLDNTATVPAVLAQLKQLENVAQKRGYAVAIGHPHDATLAALAQWLPQARAKGFRFVPLSTIIAERFPNVALPRYAQSKTSSGNQHALAASQTSTN